MKENDKIPTSKIERAAKLFKTGAKVGGNYVKYYSQKAINSDTSREELDKQNASDIFDTLSEMKGGALKVIQMMSMNRGNTIPAEYVKKFSEAQYKAPPLSYPLVEKTFRQYFGKGPLEIFDTFSKNAVHAASIGQVHEATLNGKRLAVKVQYPGVADSMKTDLAMVKPVAIRLFNIKQADLDHYMGEIEDRLLEETDYEHELQQSVEITEACAHIPNLVFPKYYPELSNKRILTMDWVDGKHLEDYLLENHSQEEHNLIGQAMWDFYDYQLHALKMLHADPHPGNFLITPEGKLAILDFGCVKRLPEAFYQAFILLLDKDLPTKHEELMSLLIRLQFLYVNDTPQDKEFFYNLTREVLDMLTRPIHQGHFDFKGTDYFTEITKYGEKMSKMKEIRETKVVRGPRDGIYIGRVYYGIYHLLHELGAAIDTRTVKG